MRELSINQIVDFRRKSDQSKKTFASKLSVVDEINKSDGGGNYWISSLSSISNAFKADDTQIIQDKIYELEDKYEKAVNKRTKDMYQRNIEILYKFETFDFSKWVPLVDFSIIKKHKSNFLLEINGLQIKAMPHHLFSFIGEDEEIGAIWFVAKLGGYPKNELAMFTDILYRCLNNVFSKKYRVNPDFCSAVDVVNVVDISYSKIAKEGIPILLDSTINEIKELLY